MIHYESRVGYVRTADWKDALALAKTLRPEDIREIKSTMDGEHSLEAVLLFNIAASTKAFTAIDRATEGVIAMFGVAPAGNGTGSIWMHGSELMRKHSISVARQTKHFAGLLHRDYEILSNWADLRNEVHINWLRWLGFRFLRVSTSFSNDGSPFVEFFRKGNSHVRSNHYGGHFDRLGDRVRGDAEPSAAVGLFRE
ncbi:putative internal virion protein [Rhizobium phage RHph_I20]|uniref:Putative internal virion protein n=1 Tax=Rhizobium phage RHph_I20 TaxID=2509730 RepID=A0A7S5RBN5_9CAUD|nr:putative internal virion protein [Rhizobium phage RHph_I20]